MGANSIHAASRLLLRVGSTPGVDGGARARNVQIFARHAPSMRAASGHTVSNERVSGAEPTTPEATMAEIDSNARHGRAIGVAPRWRALAAAGCRHGLVDPGRGYAHRGAPHVDSTAGAFRAGHPGAHHGVGGGRLDDSGRTGTRCIAGAGRLDRDRDVADNDVTETRTVRVTRRRGPRPTKVPTEPADQIATAEVGRLGRSGRGLEPAAVGHRSANRSPTAESVDRPSTPPSRRRRPSRSASPPPWRPRRKLAPTTARGRGARPTDGEPPRRAARRRARRRRRSPPPSRR